MRYNFSRLRRCQLAKNKIFLRHFSDGPGAIDSHAVLFERGSNYCASYINSSLHLARKYARIFVRGHYLFREANSFPRAKLEENCELRGTDNVQGQISVHIFEDKWRLLCLLSFKYFSHSRARGIC